MYNYFEKVLNEKSELQTSNDLWIQWETAKKYVPSVLSMISNVFPHFSLHDESHSETILENIHRILGDEQIKKLSATDIWMLLFSAYFHDIGMFVSKEDISVLIKNEDFIKFVKEAQRDNKYDTQPYAVLFEINDNKLFYKEALVTPESFNALRFLFAAYIRKSHAERSKKTIEGYKTSSFMFIPESIPSRIIDLLADICCYHQEKFEKVMLLPQVQQGVFDDYCHPRFIACMIRLGDVLDVDNNRFSSIILSTLPSIPTDSLKHIEKHLSIKFLNINTNEISIKAECKTIEVGEITTEWFNWISNEINDQTKNWHKIIPLSSFQSLPIIKQLDVQIEDFDLIPGNEIPRFSMQSSKATELLQGSGIYNNKFIFARELLQNSIDATLLRIFIENKSDIRTDDISSFRDICNSKKQNYRILFKIDTDKNDDSILHISIEDQGIGIDSEDLKYILSSGKKGKNPKTDIVDSMPEWMRPSGIFGIGLYSIFLITDCFNLETTKINSGSTISGLLYDPKSQKKGAVYIKTKKANLSEKVGTKIKFEYKSQKFPTKLSFNRKSHTVEKKYEEFDFIKNNNENFELSQIIDEIYDLGIYSDIPISLIIDGEEIDLYSKPQNFKFFDSQNAFEFNINSLDYRSLVFYRNQYLENFSLPSPFFSLQINLLCGNAKDKLDLGRTTLTNKYIPTFYKLLDDTLVNFLTNDFVNLPDSIKPFVGMFIEIETESSTSISIKPECREAWENYDFTVNEKTIKLGKLCTKKTIEIKVKTQIEKKYEDLIITKDKVSLIVNDPRNPIITFLKKYLLFKNYYFSWSWDTSESIEIIELSKDQKEYIKDLCDFKNHILKYNIMARCLIPCNEKYKALRLSKEYIDSIGYKCILPDIFTKEYRRIDFMALPYITQRKEGFGIERDIIRSDDEIFYDTVYKNRLDKSITKKEIKDTYKEFIKDFDDEKKCTVKKQKK